MGFKIIKEYLFIFLFIWYDFDVTEAGKSAGWFTSRNYTTYCHGGEFDAGLSRIPDSSTYVGIIVYIDNETRCTLKLSGDRTNYLYGSRPPSKILPADCGVFWAWSKVRAGVFGWLHYTCEEYGVLLALEYIIPKFSSNQYGLWVRGFDKGENVLTATYDAPTHSNRAVFSVYVTEKKRFCPCFDKNILETHKYKYY